MVGTEVLLHIPRDVRGERGGGEREVGRGAGTEGRGEMGGSVRVVEAGVGGGENPGREGGTREVRGPQGVPALVMGVEITQDQGVGSVREKRGVKGTGAGFNGGGADWGE